MILTSTSRGPSYPNTTFVTFCGGNRGNHGSSVLAGTLIGSQRRLVAEHHTPTPIVSYTYNVRYSIFNSSHLLIKHLYRLSGDSIVVITLVTINLAVAAPQQILDYLTY